MFREMLRKRQQISHDEAIKILEQCTCGILGLIGDEGYPYTVPLSYVFNDNKIYFHCAKTGHKLDAINSCEKASFCVVAQDNIVPEEYTTYYKSVIAFGRAKVLTDKDEILFAIDLLARKYHPSDTPQNRSHTIEHSLSALNIIELSIEHVTGKIAKELLNQP